MNVYLLKINCRVGAERVTATGREGWILEHILVDSVGGCHHHLGG